MTTLRGRALGVAVVAAVLHAGLAPTGAAARPGEQGRTSRDCDLRFRGVVVNGEQMTHLARIPSSPGRANTFAGGGVDGFCANTDQRILADSAEHYEDQRLLYLIGRVHYTENRIEMTADRVTYYLGDERLVAEGNVVGRTNTGTRFQGPRAVYLRAKPGFRARSRLDAGGRPDTWISAADAGTGAAAGDSMHIVADSIVSDNDSLVYAIGHVDLRRTDLVATADSAFVDQGREFAALRKAPRVEGVGENTYTLVGRAIDVFSRNRKAERVRSAGDARATSDDMVLAADSVDLRVTDDQLTRAIAWGPGRARASQPSREITADSIDVSMPGQVLDRIAAVRRARAESVPDTAEIRSAQRDWFAGDTIIASFEKAVANDTASAVLRTVVSRGAAQSWQQSARDGATLPDTMPAINYVAGQVIVADFNADRALERVRVTGQVTGVIVQPDTTARAKPAPRKVPPGGAR